MTAAMTYQEHKDVFQTIAETVVAEPDTEQDAGIDLRVLRGAELLDREHPGWAEKIDLELFDLTDGTNCVIGQVYGDYTGNVAHVLDLEEEQVEFEAAEHDGWFAPAVVEKAEEYGFCLAERENIDERDAEWERLDADWVVVIAERQKQQ